MWVGTLPDKKAVVNVLTFAPDGHTLYTGDSAGRVLAWDVDTRAARELFRRPEPANGNRGVHDLWLTRDGARLLVNDDRRLIDAFRPEAKPLFTAAKDSWAWWKYLLPDGRRITSVEPEWRLALWDVTTGERLPVPGELGAARDLTYHALLADGTTFLTYNAMSNELGLWNIGTGEKVGELTPRGSGIRATALSPDTTTFVVGRDMELWVYDVPARALRHKLKAARSFRELAFHPNGRLVASAATDKAATLWDVTAGVEVRRYDWALGKPQSLCFSPDGLTCAVGGSKNQFGVFDVDL